MKVRQSAATDSEVPLTARVGRTCGGGDNLSVAAGRFRQLMSVSVSGERLLAAPLVFFPVALVAATWIMRTGWRLKA